MLVVLRWREGVVLLGLVGACGPQSPVPTANGGTGTTTSNTTSPVESSSTVEDGSDSESTCGFETAATGGAPEGPLPPGLDAWGLSLTWTCITGTPFGVVDIQGDGHLDISVHTKDSDSNRVLTTQLGDGNGAFSALEPTVGPLTSTFNPHYGDYDGDGMPEILGLHPRLGLTVLDHLGDGRYDQASVAEVVRGLGNIGPAFDVDGDGLDDLLTGIGNHSTPAGVMYNRGDDRFVGTPELPYPACYFAAVVPTDMDSDGDLDMFASGGCNAGSPDMSWYLFFDNQDGTLVLQQTFAGDPRPYEADRPELLDIDGDGDMDLAMWAAALSPDQPAAQGLIVFNNQAGIEYEVEFFEYDGDMNPSVRTYGMRMMGDERWAVIADRGTYDPLLVRRAADGTGLEVDEVSLVGRPRAVADLDEDGFSDMIVTRSTEPYEMGIWLSGG